MVNIIYEITGSLRDCVLDETTFTKYYIRHTGICILRNLVLHLCDNISIRAHLTTPINLTKTVRNIPAENKAIIDSSTGKKKEKGFSFFRMVSHF